MKSKTQSLTFLSLREQAGFAFVKISSIRLRFSIEISPLFFMKLIENSTVNQSQIQALAIEII